MASVINVNQWSVEQVVDWIAGLEYPLSGYRTNFLDNQINGAKLLNFMAGDLGRIGIMRVGDQVLFHDAIHSLRNEMESDWITLQILASQLSVRSKTYRSQLTNLPKRNKIPTTYLASAAHLLDAGKTLLRWLKFPLSGVVEYDDISKKLTRYAFELAMLSQRDSFADNIIEEVQYLCTKIIEICDSIIKSRDSLVIQPASADVLTLRKRKDQEFGFQFERCDLSGQHLVSSVDLNSPAYQSGHLEIGDQILQINHQTVVGWDRQRIYSILYNKPSELTIVLTVKRKPKHGEVCDMYLRPSRTPKRRIINHVIDETHEAEVACTSVTETTVSFTNVSPPLPEVRRNTGEKERPKTPLRRRSTISGISPNRCSTSREGTDNLSTGQVRNRPPLDKSKSESEWLKCKDSENQLEQISIRREGFEMPGKSNLGPSKSLIAKDELVDGSSPEIVSTSAEDTNSPPIATPTIRNIFTDENASTFYGVLHLRGQWKFGNRWKPVKATLKDKLLLIGPNSINLEDFSLIKATEVNSRPFAMKLTSNCDEKLVYYFAAESQQEFDNWNINIGRATNMEPELHKNENANLGCGNVRGTYRRSISLTTTNASSQFERPRRISLQPQQTRVVLPKMKSISLSESVNLSPRCLVPSLKSNISSITIKSLKNRSNSSSSPLEEPSAASMKPVNTPTQPVKKPRTGKTENEFSSKPRMGVNMISPKSPTTCLSKRESRSETSESTVCKTCGSRIGVQKSNSSTQTECSVLIINGESEV